MYITSLDLENFKIHKSLHVSFSDINVIIGNNARGKTTILDAISFGLYGTTADGASKKELVTNSTMFDNDSKIPKVGKVTIQFDNGYKIIRDTGNTSQLFDSNGIKITDKATDIEKWLNIPKDMFMTLIYGCQGKMTEAFLKFGANQKDFIDNLFNISDYIDPIINMLKDVKRSIDFEYLELTNNMNNINRGNEYINKCLADMGCNNFEDIDIKITQISEQLEQFNDIETIDKLRHDYNTAKNSYASQLYIKDSSENNLKRFESAISDINNSIIDSKKSIDIMESKLLSLSTTLEKSLGITISNDINGNDIRNKINVLCDINSWYDNLINVINLIDIEHLDEYKSKALQIVNYIKQIDVYRQQYETILRDWESTKMSINSSKSFIESYNKQIESNTNAINDTKIKLTNIIESISDLNGNINILQEQLDKFGGNADGSNMEVYKKLLASKSTLISNKKSLLDYKEQLKSISFDENRFKQLDAMKLKLADIEQLFNREGFPQYIRNVYIKDIAATMNEMLLTFGFNNLLPVTVTDSGEFKYRGIRTKSISGAQKVCTSIIQKFIYGRILAPAMNLNIMMLDEPSDGLDVSRQEYFKTFLTTLSKTIGLQLIIVTHNKNIIPEDATVIEF